MKIKKIAQLVKKTQSIILYFENKGNVQWISDGQAIYPLYGMPELDEETVMTVLDIPEKDRDKYIVTLAGLPEKYSFEDEDERGTERLIPHQSLEIRWGGQELMPLRTSLGLEFIDREKLGPLSDKGDAELYERETEDGEIYIAVKAGLMLMGVILPVKTDEGAIAESMETLWRELRQSITRKA